MNMLKPSTMQDFGQLMNLPLETIYHLSQVGELCLFSIKSKQVVLAKPTTGMNKSGIAVREIMDYWGILHSEIVVILDDVDLPLGKYVYVPKVVMDAIGD